MRQKPLIGLLVAAFVLRVAAALLLPSIHHPDEIYQYLEQGHRIAFGYGGVPWEYHVGVRSWLLPGALAIVMHVCGLVASDPAVYLVTIQVLLAVLSLSAVAVGYLWANRLAGRTAVFAAATLLAFWSERPLAHSWRFP